MGIKHNQLNVKLYFCTFNIVNSNIYNICFKYNYSIYYTKIINDTNININSLTYTKYIDFGLKKKNYIYYFDKFKNLFNFLNIHKYDIVLNIITNNMYRNNFIFIFNSIDFIINSYFFKNYSLLLNYLNFYKKKKKLLIFFNPSIIIFKLLNKIRLLYIIAN